MIALALLLAALDPKVPQSTAAADAPARAAVKAMQAFYEKAKDCSASFTQTYLNTAFKKTLQSAGTLRFKKPGMLRFDYTTPEPKFFVVKNDRITSYVPAAQQAMVGSFKADQLSASVSFLFGKGKIENEFLVLASDRTDFAPGTAMLLTPKRDDPRFSRIYFVVNPETSAVVESVVVDPSGNENRFDFTAFKRTRGSPRRTSTTPFPRARRS